MSLFSTSSNYARGYKKLFESNSLDTETLLKNLIFICKKSIYIIFIVKIVGKNRLLEPCLFVQNIFLRIIFCLLKSKFVKAILIK